METLSAQDTEKKMIMQAYVRLRRKIIPYLEEGDVALIQKAFRVAHEAHRGMRRKSGEPYILHPLAVAQIVVEEINLGPTAVAAALLHDVVEDTEWTIEEIEKQFGKKIALIVDGLTKIQSSKKFDLNLGVSEQAENFRKMILTLSDDVRVILIKLADRLHNMRTLNSMDRNKQLKIAYETIYIYAPLAHRLGLYKIKTELEDLYLKYTRLDVYKEIADKLNKTKTERNRFINEFIEPLKEQLSRQGFRARTFGRPKSIYSIWNKMQKQNIPFEKIYDLFAIRIVIDSEGPDEKIDCWRVYSLVTDFYTPNPDRLRDWISNPRGNGYESLHTTVMGSEGRWVEVQIRTRRMDEIAEYGYAAHWKYKEQGKSEATSQRKKEESGLDAWVRSVREMREKNQELSATEFITAFRNNFFRDEVFVFTPKGDLRKLPIGSSVLDFAFDIHTHIGLNCLGAKVNQRLVPLSYELKNGDQIEIITSKQAKPNADWLRYVITTKAKTGIKDFIRHEKKQLILAGKEIVQKKFRQYKLDYNDLNINLMAQHLQLKNVSDVFFQIGQGYISTKQLNQYCEVRLNRQKAQEAKNAPAPPAPVENGRHDPNTLSFDLKKDTLVIGDDKTQMTYTLAKCCNPLPGDDIFGFITINEGVKIHRIDCPNAVEMMSKYSYRVINAIWKSQKDILFLTELKILGNDRLGIARDVTQVISSDMKVNINAIQMGTTAEGIFEGEIRLYVRDHEHLIELIKKLQNIEGVQQVTRLDHQEDQD
ncbi:MAG: RelA/SpoT family protein [Microscillaceae bacterium]